MWSLISYAFLPSQHQGSHLLGTLLNKSNSSTACGYGQLHESRYYPDHREAYHSQRSSIQGAQKNGNCAIHVLQSRSVIFSSFWLMIVYQICPVFDNDPQMMFATLSLSSSKQNMVERDTYVNHWAHMGTSKHTLMATSIKWTLCACSCTNAYIQNGPIYGLDRTVLEQQRVLRRAIQDI